jgi:prepilin peptidase CpaA
MLIALTAFHLAVLFIAAVILLAAAINDAYSYRIPNYMCGLLLLMFPVFVVSAPHAVPWLQNIFVFVLVSLAGFAAFLGNLTGAGDVKLLAVSSLWAGPHYIAMLLTVTAVAGGIESLVMAVKAYLRRSPDAHGELGKVQVPYGVAIASGGLVMLGMMAKPILLPG